MGQGARVNSSTSAARIGSLPARPVESLTLSTSGVLSVNDRRQNAGVPQQTSSRNRSSTPSGSNGSTFTAVLKLAVQAAFSIHPGVRVAASNHYFGALDTALEDANRRDAPTCDPAINNATHIPARRLTASLRDREYGSGGLKLGAVFATESVPGVRCYLRRTTSPHDRSSSPRATPRLRRRATRHRILRSSWILYVMSLTCHLIWRRQWPRRWRKKSGGFRRTRSGRSEPQKWLTIVWATRDNIFRAIVSFGSLCIMLNRD